MQAMIMRETGSFKDNRKPLRLVSVPEPELDEHEILIRVSACGVCHTELDEIEGRTPPPFLPVIPGHQVVGEVCERGKQAETFKIGDRVGVGWIFSACGHCEFCLRGEENICASFRATGRDADGGYAEYMKIHEAFAYHVPQLFSDSEAAPLLCAGAIGYRSLRLSGLHDGQMLGLTGFGASAHLVLQMVLHRYPHSQVYVFARSEKEQEFARELGAGWAGATEARSPVKLHAIIDTTPVWKPVVHALENLEQGGKLVINAIRKEEEDKEILQQLRYEQHLWCEKEIKSVANVTRNDIREFLVLAERIPLKPEYQEFSLIEANEALAELKDRKIRGAKVLRIRR